MNRRVVAVLVGTLLALVATTLWVPTVSRLQFIGMARSGGSAFPEYRSIRFLSDEGGDAGICLDAELVEVYWPIVFIEHAAILLLGSGLLTWVVRRERRRRAEAGT